MFKGRLEIVQQRGPLVLVVGILLSLSALAGAQVSDDSGQTSSLDEVQVLYNSALSAKADGAYLKAREELETILHNYPGFIKIISVKKEWGEVMMHLIHSRIPSHETLFYEVQSNDSLERIAKEHGTTIDLIKIRNKLKDTRLKLGQKLSLWNHPFNIDVNKTKNRLYLKMDSETIKEYIVSTGKSDSLTPLGEFVIKYRYPFPTWFHHGKVVEGGSKENLLGTRWLGFNIPKYGIHGTIYPELLGQSVSGGCIRMKNQDVEELYDMIPVGTKVVVREQNDEEVQDLAQ
ncbi:MAG: L,D-transpeptidase family protein [Candidatus Omnitrophica bacterium]|nr:L,D-transpeptidase family protein [Candidatus Omnitrophota bacterium]